MTKKNAVVFGILAALAAIYYLYNKNKTTPAAAAPPIDNSFIPQTDTSVLDHDTWMGLYGFDF